MAVHHLPMVHFPRGVPCKESAVRTVSEYLSHAGTQIVSDLLGCPALDRNAATVVEFSNQKLQSAALYQGIL